jgi:rubredoxin
MSDAEAQAASEPSPAPFPEQAPEPTPEPAPEQVLELALEAAPGATTESTTESVVESPSDDPADHRFECLSCGFVYDPAEGIKKLKIAAGIPFLELDPASFRCPVCRSKMGAFKDIGPRNKPSGFEENLNFGLGVNRLTPGQKNVLIFGGFALAVAFFLSLYSLR